MDYTFMTIHDLGADANILFASDSITDILGYRPSDVLNKSCFDFFHPDEVPFARSIHSRGVLLDKAAVLHYVRIRSRNGDWVSCECCFTVVHDVLVACISIYQGNEKNQKRALDAPQIRRIFSCSPRDPRYHMLQHLSPKFEMPPSHREPRAALILNRFTRSLSVMFCTNAIASILGLPAEEVQAKSFYECIQESCLDDAVKCLESAKANDSIAYMRFWSRDPRRPEDIEEEDSEDDEDDEDAATDGMQQDGVEIDGVDDHAIKEESDGEGIGDGIRSYHQRSHDSQLSDSDSGGVRLDDEMDIDSDGQSGRRVKVEEDMDGISAIPPSHQEMGDSVPMAESSTSSSNTGNGATIGNRSGAPRATSSTRNGRRRPRYPLPAVELEAVVSCTSDGLVVILRKARPPIPNAQRPTAFVTPQQGIFAAPWGQYPVQSQYPAHFQAQTEPFPVYQGHSMAQTASTHSRGPPLDHLMESIREIAVFAWAVVGINGNLASYSRGNPMAGAQPVGGLPIWDPNVAQTSYQGPENQAVARWAAYENGTLPGPSRGFGEGGSSRQAGASGSRDAKGRSNHHPYRYDGGSNGHSSETAAKQSGHTPNGYNSHLPTGHSGHMPDGHRSYMPDGHNSHVPTGHNGYTSNGHNGYTPNGHNGHVPDGRSGPVSDGYSSHTSAGNSGYASNEQSDHAANGHSNDALDEEDNDTSNGQSRYAMDGRHHNLGTYGDGVFDDEGNHLDRTTYTQNGYSQNTDDQPYYIFGSGPWRPRRRENNEQATAGLEQPQPMDGHHGDSSDGHTWNDGSAEDGWHFSPGVHQNSMNNGTSSNHNNGNQH